MGIYECCLCSTVCSLQQEPHSSVVWDCQGLYIQLFAPFDKNLNHMSYGTIKVCEFSEHASLTFVDIKRIVSIVGMVPHVFNTLPSASGEKYFVVDMSKLDNAYNRPDAVDIDSDDDNLNDAYDM